MHRRTTFILCLCFLFYLNSLFASDKKIITLYLDADWSNHTESAQSIWRGVTTALSEVNHTVQGYQIKLVKKDHSGNVLRSRRTMTEFIDDPQALAIIAGMHSPPLIKYRKFINQNKILTLVPWAAGGPITRYPSTENWVFRLSLDDSKVSDVLINFALDTKQCKSPHLVLENTPWGESNLVSLSKALDDRGKQVNVSRFDWNLKSYSAINLLDTIVVQENDCIVLVANSKEGAVLAKAMASLPAEKRVPIISHWGITGGDFHHVVDAKIRQTIDLSFIQSCFSFINSPLSIKGQQVLAQAKLVFADNINHGIDIQSPTGFIHGYDLTRLLLESLKQVGLTDDMAENRNAVRLALENIEYPVTGLVKTYHKPFSVFTPSNVDAHEALDTTDFCMAMYDEQDAIKLINVKE